MTLQTLTNGTSLIVLCLFEHRIYFCRQLTVSLNHRSFYPPNDHSPETGVLIVAVYWVDGRSYHSRARVHRTPNGFVAAGNLLTEWMAVEDDFTTRLAERSKTKVDCYQVMVALNKSLWDMFENCTEEFFEEMKRECEIANRAMAIRVRQYLVQNSGKVSDVINSGAVLCKPTNVLNVGNEHRKHLNWHLFSIKSYHNEILSLFSVPHFFLLHYGEFLQNASFFGCCMSFMLL